MALGCGLLHSRGEGCAKYKDFILPLVFTKRLCDVFDDELNRIAKEVGAGQSFKLVKRDKKLVRFYIPLKPAESRGACLVGDSQAGG